MQLIWQYFDLSFFNERKETRRYSYQIMRWWIRDTGPKQIHNSGSNFQVTNLIRKGTHDFSPWKGHVFLPKKNSRGRTRDHHVFWYLIPASSKNVLSGCVLNGWYDDKGPYTTSVWVEKTQFFLLDVTKFLFNINSPSLHISPYITISLSISRTRFPTHLAEWLGGSPFYKPPGVVTLNHPETH